MYVYMYLCVCIFLYAFFFNHEHEHLLLIRLMYFYITCQLIFSICFSVTDRIKENIFAESDCVLMYWCCY